jgi:hypothetical protein
MPRSPTNRRHHGPVHSPDTVRFSLPESLRRERDPLCQNHHWRDTHKNVHAAVAINGIGARLGTLTIPVRPQGYRNLETWARAFGAIHAFGIEGTGSYGAGLSRFCRRRGILLSK